MGPFVNAALKDEDFFLSNALGLEIGILFTTLLSTSDDGVGDAFSVLPAPRHFTMLTRSGSLSAGFP
jgi:hypothetical protein